MALYEMTPRRLLQRVDAAVGSLPVPDVDTRVGLTKKGQMPKIAQKYK